MSLNIDKRFSKQMLKTSKKNFHFSHLLSRPTGVAGGGQFVHAGPLVER
jgi:hypothetical protein